ncbi:phage tail tape measure protein [Levilactobacillus sp. 244-2]|uniref:phage tail tape measure protein n=1 Tax=Levilactobacillus sp. 244-2 TaxID=2799569 RepID=UPI00194E14C8|nr:phage tail tape measure protein [Levilactobacillus sp. 244-2]
MADVIRGADIGIGLDIPDLGNLKKLNSAINSLIKQGDEIGHLSSQFKAMFSAFDQGTVGRVKSVSSSLKEVNQVIRDINRSSSSVRHTSDETSRTTSRNQHQYQDSLSKSRQYVKSLMDANEAYVRRLRMEGGQTKATEAKVDGLKNSHEALTNLLNKERSYLNQIKTASGENSTAYNRQSTQVNKLRSQIARNNGALAETKSKMKATSAETINFNRHGEKLRGTFSGLRNVFTAAIPSVLGLGAAFSKAAGEATKLQDQYTTVKGLLSTSGESNQQAAASTHEIQSGNRRLSKRYGIGQSNLASGSEQLIRRGYSSKQEAGSHKSFVQASIATKDPYSSVVNYGSSALEQFGYRQKAGNSVGKMKKYTNQVLNQMSYVADLTATDFPGIGEALKYAGATAHSAHQSLASATASLGSLSNHGLDGSIAGTGYRKVINAFAAPSSSPKSSQYAAMQQYHLKSGDFLDKNHNLKSMPDLMDILNSHLKGQSGTQRLKFMHNFFGTTGQEAGNYLAENPNEIRKLTKQAQNATRQKNGKSYNENLAAKNMKSWQNQLNRTKAILSDMGMSFARSILPGLAGGLKYINKILTAINKWPKGVKTTLATLLTITGVLTGLLATFKLLKTAGGFLLGFGGKGKALKSVTTATEAVARSKGSRTVFGDAFKGLKSVGRNGLEKVLSFNDSKGIFTALGKNKSLLGGGTKNIFAGAKGLFKSGGMRAVTGDATKGLLKTGAKGLLSATPFDAVMSATELIGMNKKNRGEKIGRAGGSFAGGAAGAAIGTAILPGIGTVLGGIGGTLLGTKLGGSIGKGIQKAFPAIRKTMSNLFKGNLGWEKAIGGAFTKAFKGVGRFFTGKLGWEQSLGKNVTGMVKSVQRALRPLGKAFSSVFGVVGKIIKGFVTGLKYAFVVPIALVIGLGIKAWQKFSGPVKKALSPVTKFISSSFKAIKSTISGVWKWLGKTTSGVWNSFKKHVTTPVKGTFNAINKWVVKKIVGAVKGAWSSIKKVTKATWSLIKRYVVNPVKAVYSAVNRYVVRLVVRKVKDAWSDLKSATRAAWKLIKKYVVNPVHDAYDAVMDVMSKLKKGISDKMDDISSAWNKAWNGIGDMFKSIWKKIKGYARDGINSIIGVINAGIGGIDTVVHAFGGSSKAITKIPKANFATGTGYLGSSHRRAITRPTMATLNDGFDSPETGNREMVLHPNGMSELIHGRNVQRVLEPGAEVLSATETKFNTGHFAKGTGFLSGIASAASKAVKGAVNFAGGAFKSITGKFKTIKKLISNPSGYLSGLLHKPVGNSDVMKQFAGGFYNNVKNQAKSWWSTLWSMASNVLSAGGGGPVSHSPGSGWSVSSGFGNRGAVSGGFSSHDGVDFSGAKVVHALQDAIVTGVGGAPSGWGGNSGIGQHVDTKGGKLSLIYQELNGKSNSGASILVHKGEHVKQGQALAKLGPAGTHVHIGASTEGLWTHGGGSTRGWLDVTKLHGNYGNKSKSIKNKGPMQSLIKSETGGLFAWIKKHLAPLADDGGDGSGSSAAPTGSHKHWLKQAGIPESWWSATNEIISAESGWNPKAHNASGAYGLPQSLPASKMASAGSDWRTNPITQLKWYKSYINSRYGGISKALAFRHAHGWYANGGDVPAGQLSVVGEKGWELIAPKQKSHVYDHKTSQKIVKGLSGGTTVKVTGSPVYVTVEGDADDKAIGKIQDAVNESNDSLVDKFLEKMGANELGGIPI